MITQETEKLIKNKDKAKNEPKLVFIPTDEKRWNSEEDQEKTYVILGLIEKKKSEETTNFDCDTENSPTIIFIRFLLNCKNDAPPFRIHI